MRERENFANNLNGIDDMVGCCCRTEILGISRSAGASPLLSRKLKAHRRQLSDPKLSLPFSPIQEDQGDSELQDFDRV